MDVVLTGRNELEKAGNYAYSKAGVSSIGHVATDAYLQPQHQSAFGELSVAQFEPLISWTFAYNINSLLIAQEIITTGTVTNAESSAILQTGTAADGKAKIETVKGSRYIPGIGGLARWTTVYDTPKSNSLQLQGLINTTDGWGFGYDGLKFGIVRIKDDIKYWTYQEDWNIDTKPELNPQKGNVYQLSYQWLGYGKQDFFMEDDNGDLALVHRIKYSNLNDFVSVSNPNLPLSACVENTGNTTNIKLKTPSAVAGLIGNAYNDSFSVHLGDDVEKTITSGTLIPLLSIRMADTYYGKKNIVFAQAMRLLLAADMNKNITIRAYAGGTVTGGTWNFLLESAAPVESNKTYTSYTPGVLVGTFPLSKIDSYQVDLESSQFKLFGGQLLTLVASTTGSGDITVGANIKVFV